MLSSLRRYSITKFEILLFHKVLGCQRSRKYLGENEKFRETVFACFHMGPGRVFIYQKMIENIVTQSL